MRRVSQECPNRHSYAPPRIASCSPSRCRSRSRRGQAARTRMATSRAAHTARRCKALRTPSPSRATAHAHGDGFRAEATACEMDARGSSLRPRFVFSVEGPSPCRGAAVSTASPVAPAGARRALIRIPRDRCRSSKELSSATGYAQRRGGARSEVSPARVAWRVSVAARPILE